MNMLPRTVYYATPATTPSFTRINIPAFAHNVSVSIDNTTDQIMYVADQSGFSEYAIIPSNSVVNFIMESSTSELFLKMAATPSTGSVLVNVETDTVIIVQNKVVATKELPQIRSSGPIIITDRAPEE